MSRELAMMRCVVPLQGGPMAAQEIDDHLKKVQGWSLVGGAIEKTFSFANYHQTMAFVNAAAWIAHREDHHPDVAFGYNRCSLRFNTHDVNGISVSDFHCAAAVNALFAG